MAKHITTDWFWGLLRAAKMYVPVHFVPMLLFKSRTLLKVDACLTMKWFAGFVRVREILLCNERIEAPSLVSVQEPVRQLTATAKATLLSCIFLSTYVFFVKVRFNPLQPPMPFASLWTATQNPKPFSTRL